MPADPLAAFLTAVETAHAAGNATEHTYRPFLKTLFERLAPGLTATNEPKKRTDCGAPDMVLAGADGATTGYAEAKDLDVSLEAIERDSERATPQTREGLQLKRYRAALPNLLLTDCLEFRLFSNGVRQQAPARLARTAAHGALAREKDDSAARALLRDFLSSRPAGIGNPRELAERLARLTHLIRDIVVAAFTRDEASATLRGLDKALRDLLIADLDTGEFADMFAQTLTYGLFAARANHSGPAPFTLAGAARDIPKTNPFLRRLFRHINDELEDEPYAGLVNDLTQLLAATDMGAVLAGFGRRTRRQDPVVHFYESFLAAYDPRLREARGVYYTPEPVVSYLVRSVDHLLKTRFVCPAGLADRSKTTYTRSGPDGRPETVTDHRVLVLDPACGTGSFLYAVVDHIRQTMMAEGDAGDWSDYVHDHLLPRLFGFELLMAPYAVAHLKLGLQLAGKDLPPAAQADWAYSFQGDERLGVYLTNTLEEAHPRSEMLMGQWISDEANAAAEIKRERPIMVVIGNPPYSGHSANNSAWIRGLVRDYYFVDGRPLGERNPKWLQDDYVKFIRFGQWRIDQSTRGVLAYINNNGYLDNPTFRGMRQQLMQSFSDIYILNLHGNSKKRERAPGGGPDENVFDIQQGVAIALFVKDPAQPGPATVHYADMWGERETADGESGKYAWLFAHDLADTPWIEHTPQSPFYLFVRQDTDKQAEDEEEWSITNALPIHGWGVATRKDYLLVDFDRGVMIKRFKDVKSMTVEQAVANFQIKNSPHWNFAAAKAQLAVDTEAHVKPILFRPFDIRYVYYEKCMIERGDHRFELMSQMFQPNLALITVRRTETADLPAHFYCTNEISVLHSTSAKEGNFVFPLYLYPETPGQPYQRADAIEAATKAIRTGGQVPANQIAAEQERVTALIKRLFPEPAYPRWPNLAPDFLADVAERLGWAFVPAGQGDLQRTFGPEDLFHYLYAVFHAPSYRQRYADFLKIDFPRVPLTADPALFRALAGLGAELVGWHLLRTPAPPGQAPRYPVAGSNRVEPGYPKYVAPGAAAPGAATPVPAGRVYINLQQYFEGVPPEVWAFPIGGYQVADKWLKDRRGRVLTLDERDHYRHTLAALAATIRLMARIDAAIPGWPLP